MTTHIHTYTAVLFDLDGTLSQSAPGITKSLQYGLTAVGIDEPDLSSLRRFVGPPLSIELAKVYGLSRPDITRVVARFRERYETVGLYETALYPGIASLVQDLHAAGYLLAVASSKPEPFVKHLVAEHFGLAPYFSLLCGSSIEAELAGKTHANDKELVIRRVLDALQKLDPAAAARPIMVGDTVYDIRGAAANGIDAIAVTYGYGQRADLEAEYPAHLAGSTDELRRILL